MFLLTFLHFSLQLSVKSLLKEKENRHHCKRSQAQGFLSFQVRRLLPTFQGVQIASHQVSPSALTSYLLSLLLSSLHLRNTNHIKGFKGFIRDYPVTCPLGPRVPIFLFTVGSEVIEMKNGFQFWTQTQEQNQTSRKTFPPLFCWIPATQLSSSFPEQHLCPQCSCPGHLHS